MNNLLTVVNIVNMKITFNNVPYFLNDIIYSIVKY